MILGAIAILLLCAILPPAIGSGDTGVTVFILVVAGILFMCAHENHKSAVAWHNRREYWYKGGPDQYRNRK